MKLFAPNTRPALLSTLWVVLMLNYLYCDVLGLYDPHHLVALQEQTIGGVPFTPEALVAAGVLMQIPIAMVLLSRVLRQGLARWVNVATATVMGAVQVSTLFFGTPPTPVYAFFSAIEIALAIAIVAIALTWRRASEPVAHENRTVAA